MSGWTCIYLYCCSVDLLLKWKKKKIRGNWEKKYIPNLLCTLDSSLIDTDVSNSSPWDACCHVKAAIWGVFFKQKTMNSAEVKKCDRCEHPSSQGLVAPVYRWARTRREGHVNIPPQSHGARLSTAKVSPGDAWQLRVITRKAVSPQRCTNTRSQRSPVREKMTLRRQHAVCSLWPPHRGRLCRLTQGPFMRTFSAVSQYFF